jgi:hypothetical protein
MSKNLNVLAATAVLLLSARMLPASDASETLLAPARNSLVSRPSELRTPAQPNWQKRWAVSLAPLAISQSLDAASSYGGRELNPLLAGPNGGFGRKATGIKFGVAGALAGVEYLLVKKYPRSAKFFTVVNWTSAGATTALAVHNFQLPRD